LALFPSARAFYPGQAPKTVLLIFYIFARRFRDSKIAVKQSKSRGGVTHHGRLD
jgi:hypothetical protein